jgi:hypothetical protein
VIRWLAFDMTDTRLRQVRKRNRKRLIAHRCRVVPRLVPFLHLHAARGANIRRVQLGEMEQDLRVRITAA